MSDLVAVIRATRASATAVSTMARLTREIRDADKSMAWNAAMVARGYMSADAAAKSNSFYVADKNKAMMELARARGRYERANLILKRNPI